MWGIDASPRAVRKAEEKASARGLRVNFRVMNALSLDTLGRTFDTATDSGLFHTLSDADRPVFVKNLAAALVPGGKYFMLCFSDLEPAGYGPRRISKRDIGESFGDGWTIDFIRPATFESHTRVQGTKAWISGISRW